MMWRTHGVAYVFLFCLLCDLRIVVSKTKTIKLIVPHKIKYIHHTHVLLVKPKKKPKIIEEIEDDSPGNYQHYHEHHHEERPRHKGKPKVHYVVPYVDESKERTTTYPLPLKKDVVYEELEPYYVPMQNYRKGRMPSDEVRTYVVHPPQRGHKIVHQEATSPSTRYAMRYLYPPERPAADSQQYETKYLGYSSYAEDDPNEETTARSSRYVTSPIPEITTARNSYYSDAYQHYAQPYDYKKWGNQ